MNNELLTAFSVALLGISAIAAYYCVRFQIFRAQYPAKREDEIDISSLVWGMLFFIIGIFMQSFLYLLWDFEVIYKSIQYKLSVLPRASFLAGICLFFLSMEFARDKMFRLVCVSSAILVVALIYVLRVIS